MVGAQFSKAKLVLINHDCKTLRGLIRYYLRLRGRGGEGLDNCLSLKSGEEGWLIEDA